MSVMDKRPPVVLVADDDDDIVALVAYDLETEGFEVLTARDGGAALRLALERRPHVAILDVGMPKLGGYELARRIREHAALDQTAVVLLTARAELVDILHGFDSGADDYVTKPFEPDELRTRVHALLRVRASLPRDRAAGS